MWTFIWRFLAYALGILLLAAALVAQVSYRHLASISQHETYRPWLLAFCDYAQCALPTRRDSKLIVSTQLSVEPHPLYQDVSQIKLDFTNTAGFSQPLPQIELVFSDIQGRNIAGRRFGAEEYLPRLSAILPEPATLMSAGESVTAQLEIANPAADAVNYRVRFVYE